MWGALKSEHVHIKGGQTFNGAQFHLWRVSESAQRSSLDFISSTLTTQPSQFSFTSSSSQQLWTSSVLTACLCCSLFCPHLILPFSPLFFLLSLHLILPLFSGLAAPSDTIPLLHDSVNLPSIPYTCSWQRSGKCFEALPPAGWVIKKQHIQQLQPVHT